MKTLFAAGLLALSGLNAQAGTVTIDFNGLGLGPLHTGNFVIDGYRFSPQCHVDTNSTLAPGHDMIGWDGDVCDTTSNPNYLGQPAGNIPAKFYIDHGGALFDVLSIVGWGYDTPNTSAWFTSSKGGSVFLPLGYGQLSSAAFNGDEWKDVEWIVAINGGGGPMYWLDSITLSAVPEPGALALVALALAGAAAARRRRP